MECSVFRSARPACLLCNALHLRSSLVFRQRITRTITAAVPSRQQQTRNASTRAPARVLGTTAGRQKPSQAHQRQTRLSSQDSSRIQRLVDRILHHPSIPPASETLQALRAIEDSARQLLGVQEVEPNKRVVTADKTPASALLSLDSHPVETGKPAAEAIQFLSQLAYDVVKNERVDMTPGILKTYVEIQSLLSRPSTFPEIFNLYSTKPIASNTSSADPSSIKFEAPAPNAIATAVPTPVARLALSTAIRVRDLNSALDIIETTFRMKAFERNKIFRYALPPIVGASLAPVAAYALAAQFSALQTNLPAENATTIAFAGLTTYVAVTGMLGYVALTTSNDQMERVTWVLGLPLWERWAREEERAACEAVAKAWGFREKSKWGEEEGERWEGLKEWLGVRGMILDKVGLMEGME